MENAVLFYRKSIKLQVLRNIANYLPVSNFFQT